MRLPSRAAATMDFEALRFAGIRVDAEGHASVVNAATMPASATVEKFSAT